MYSTVVEGGWGMFNTIQTVKAIFISLVLQVQFPSIQGNNSADAVIRSVYADF